MGRRRTHASSSLDLNRRTSSPGTRLKMELLESRNAPSSLLAVLGGALGSAFVEANDFLASAYEGGYAIRPEGLAGGEGSPVFGTQTAGGFWVSRDRYFTLAGEDDPIQDRFQIDDELRRTQSRRQTPSAVTAMANGTGGGTGTVPAALDWGAAIVGVRSRAADIAAALARPYAIPASFAFNGHGSGGVKATGAVAQESYRQTPAAVTSADGSGDGTGTVFATFDGTGTLPTTFDGMGTNLSLTDAAGQPLSVTIDANTLVVGAATWCGATAMFKEALMAAADEVAGLRIIFAFGDEGGTGPGGVLNAEFLADLPGEAVFLAEGSAVPGAFPMAFNPTTGTFNGNAFDAVGRWLAGDDMYRTAPLALVDRTGAPLHVALDDANTLVVGAATWCGATQKFVAALNTPEVAAQLAGLRIVFAFDNEGGDGPGGVLNPEFLDNLPGEVAFLAPGSVRPERLPSAYNTATGEFDLTAVDAVNAWVGGYDVNDSAASGSASVVTGSTCGNKNLDVVNEPPALAGGAASAAVCVLAGDFDNDGDVDGRDFLVWQRDFGLTGEGLAADGNGNGEVDGDDLLIWQDNFGEVCTAQFPGEFSITPIGLQTKTHYEFTWEESAGATSYRVVLSQQPDLSAPVHDGIVTTNSFSSRQNFGQSYYIGVTAINDAGETTAANQGLLVHGEYPQPEQIIFVSEAKFFISPTAQYPPSAISFNGHAAANYHCTNMAHHAGLLPNWNLETIHFRAVLAEGNIDIFNASSIFNDVYRNANGQVVATSLDTLFTDPWDSPVLTQRGYPLTGAQGIWTGALANGDAAASKCDNWGVNTTTSFVNAANINGTGTGRLFYGQVSCASQQRFYCVGNMPSHLTSNSWLTQLTFEDLTAGTQVPANYGGRPAMSFGSDWNVANDYLDGQLRFTGNYVNFTEAVTTLSWNNSIELNIPELHAGANGLAGLEIRLKDAGGNVIRTETIPPVDPGESREASLKLIFKAEVATYEFVRIENPNAPGAPAPIDALLIVSRY